MSEEILKRKLRKGLEKDFFVFSEVPGHHSIYNKTLKIDFMLKPKEHLIRAGFVDEWFGVECKWAEGVSGQTSKITRMFWQSITYAQGQFTVNDETVVPRFIAIYVPDSLEPSIEKHLNTLSQLALYGNVGELFFYRDGNWGIKFTYLYARSNVDGFKISENRLPKKRAGHV
jgi:hypothetical protein